MSSIDIKKIDTEEKRGLKKGLILSIAFVSLLSVFTFLVLNRNYISNVESRGVFSMGGNYSRNSNGISSVVTYNSRTDYKPSDNSTKKQQTTLNNNFVTNNKCPLPIVLVRLLDCNPTPVKMSQGQGTQNINKIFSNAGNNLSNLINKIQSKKTSNAIQCSETYIMTNADNNYFYSVKLILTDKNGICVNGTKISIPVGSTVDVEAYYTINHTRNISDEYIGISADEINLNGSQTPYELNSKVPGSEYRNFAPYQRTIQYIATKNNPKYSAGNTFQIASEFIFGSTGEYQIDANSYGYYLSTNNDCANGYCGPELGIVFNVQ